MSLESITELDLSKVWIFQVDTDAELQELHGYLQKVKKENPLLQQLTGLVMSGQIKITPVSPNQLAVIQAKPAFEEDLANGIRSLRAEAPQFAQQVLMVSDDIKVTIQTDEWLQAYIRGLQDILEKRRQNP